MQNAPKMIELNPVSAPSHNVNTLALIQNCSLRRWIIPRKDGHCPRHPHPYPDTLEYVPFAHKLKFHPRKGHPGNWERVKNLQNKE